MADGNNVRHCYACAAEGGGVDEGEAGGRGWRGEGGIVGGKGEMGVCGVVDGWG